MLTGLANFAPLVLGVLSEAQLLLQSVACSKQRLKLWSLSKEVCYQPEKHEAAHLVRSLMALAAMHCPLHLEVVVQQDDCSCRLLASYYAHHLLSVISVRVEEMG